MSKLSKNLVALGLAAAMCLPLVAAASVSDGAGSGPVQLAADMKMVTNNFQAVGNESGLKTSRDFPQMVGAIINAFLGLLGIVLVVIVIYAGYLWMTDMGNADNVKKAKSMMVQAIIGMIILMAAYAITQFILNAVFTGTGVTS
jgi:hypothetical protein